MKLRLLAVFVLAFVLPASARGPMLAGADDPGMIVYRFTRNGSRADFLRELKAAVAGHTDGWYKDEFPSLISALQHEPQQPAGYGKPAKQRSVDESINASIYDLSEVSDDYKNPKRLEAQSRLKATGPAAMDALIAALDDDTPTRQLIPEAGESLNILLRRSDLALDCIERFSGIRFFNRTQGRGGAFHNDAQRASVQENIHSWWKSARGKSQADGLRVQLGLWRQNNTLSKSPYIEADLLFTLAQLEAPSRVIPRLRELCAADTMGLNSSITEGMLRLDPQFILRLTFDRLTTHQLRDGDYVLLFEYGDKNIYQELSRRAQDNRFDPSSWILGGQAEYAAKYGKNWGIPIIAAILTKTEMTGSRSFGGPAQNFCAADEAIVPFAELTGKDFGYQRDGSEADRQAAIHRAHEWWIKEGRIALADKIAADHPSATDGTDLLATDDQIAASVNRIASPNSSTARAEVAAQGKVFSSRIEEALMNRLGAEPDPAQRALILQKLNQPQLWQAPALAGVFANDASMDVKKAAGAALVTALEFDASMTWNRRIETRDQAVATVRRVAANPPNELLMPVIQIIMKHGSPDDLPVVRMLANREPARSDPAVKKYLER